MSKVEKLIVLAVIGAGLWFANKPAKPESKVAPCPRPGPCPIPAPTPKRPWAEATGDAVVSRVHIGGPIAPDGRTEVTCDLPVDMRTRNVGGSDGAGLCVFSSIGHAARWSNETRLWDFQKQMRQERGGGWPDKVDKMIAKYGPGTPYIQYTGNDPAILKAALATGRMPSVTYNGNHMVNLIYLDDTWAAVLDNNYVGENEIRWFPTEEFLRLWRTGGQAWTVVLLAPPPPDPPIN